MKSSMFISYFRFMKNTLPARIFAALLIFIFLNTKSLCNQDNRKMWTLVHDVNSKISLRYKGDFTEKYHDDGFLIDDNDYPFRITNTIPLIHKILTLSDFRSLLDYLGNPTPGQTGLNIWINKDVEYKVESWNIVTKLDDFIYLSRIIIQFERTHESKNENIDDDWSVSDVSIKLSITTE